MSLKALSPLAIGLALAFAGNAALADEATAKSNGCTACHAIDKKIVGPAYKSIAEKYKGDATAADRLAKEVRTGHKGTWGNVPMPPQSKIDADLKKAIAWVLAL